MKLNNNIPAINGLRGIAALMVTLFHFSKGFFDEDSIVRNIFRFGWTGVEIFFVISGFVITWSMINSNYKFQNFLTFLLKRLIRIEPPYLFSIIIIISLNYLSSLFSSYNGPAFSFDISNILLHIGYLVRLFDATWFNPVYWSLEIEFHFYLIIALVIPLLIHNKRIIQIISLTILLLGIFLKSDFTPLFKYIDIFLIGIVIALFKAHKFPLYLFYSFVFVITVSILLQHNWIISIVVITTATIILYKDSILNHTIFSYLGKISYSLYLLHVPIGGRIINLAKRFDLDELGKILVLILTLFSSIGIAHLFYHFIERPFQNKAKKINYNK